MIRGLSHLAFSVADMDASIRFYVDWLGFKHAFELHDEQDRPWIHYLKVADGQFIELFYGSRLPDAPASFQHLCLEVDDITATVEDLRQKGVAIDEEPKQGCDLNWQAWIRDPDGNRIELMQFHLDCPQLHC
ncbi:MAG: VOC family protein [Acutalibacteraceae bacterium]|jgi:lactoylglutathione lyase